MSRGFERLSRIKEYYRFSKIEVNTLALLSVATGFIFSIKHPGESFQILNWLKYLILATILAAISFFIRLSLQKIDGLGKGYLIEFKMWWEGLAGSILISLITLGNLPLIFAGTITSTFMVRHRLGEFRYGYSQEENSIIGIWGLIGNIILALFFGTLAYFFPENFFFTTGAVMNLIMGLTFMLPLPQLEGMQIFFGSRFFYFASLLLLLLVGFLILTGTKIGLIIGILIMAIIGIVRLLWGS